MARALQSRDKFSAALPRPSGAPPASGFSGNCLFPLEAGELPDITAMQPWVGMRRTGIESTRIVFAALTAGVSPVSPRRESGTCDTRRARQVRAVPAPRLSGR